MQRFGNMFTFIILVITLTPFVWWYYYLFKYRSLNKIPGPHPLPVIGNAIDIGKDPVELLNKMGLFSRKYQGLYKFFIGPSVRVVFAKPDYVEKILTSTTEISKSDGYNLVKSWLGDGLLVSTGDKWRLRRKIITPTFHFKILEDFVTIFNSCGDVLIKKLHAETDSDYIDIKPFINVYSLDVICETAMGVKIDSQGNKHVEYVNAVREYLNVMIKRFFSIWKRFDALFALSPEYKPNESYLKTLHDFSNKIISRRKEELVKNNFKPIVNEDGTKNKIALLDLLLQSDMHDEGLREEINTFIFEGHDTVTPGICFALLALANNPKVQQKVYEEISNELKSKQEIITIQNLQNLKYLDMVIKEAQRIYPSVPLFERQLQQDMTINKTTFPKGTTISLFIYAMHNDPELFPEPEKFDPDRFLPENILKRHTFAYVPFSAGVRNCIGQKFAMLEMKATVTKIVQHFKLLPVKGFQPLLGMSAMLQSYNGIRVKLEQR